MSSNKNSYPIPDGYKEIEFQTENHIDHIGKGFHKKDAEGNLVMAFYVKPENGNSGGVAHGGMLMSIADYSLCSAAMESREKYVATISFRSEFISGAKIGSVGSSYKNFETYQIFSFRRRNNNVRRKKNYAFLRRSKKNVNKKIKLIF